MAKNKGIYSKEGLGILFVLDVDKRWTKSYFKYHIPSAIRVEDETRECLKEHLEPKLFKLPYEFITFHGEQDEF